MKPAEIQGKKILLRELAENEVPQVCAWRNNPDVSDFFYRKHIEPDEYMKWMKEVESDPAQGHFAVVRKSDSRLLGVVTCKIKNNSEGKPVATIGIIIGDSAERGKGHGGEAMELLARWLARNHGVVKTAVEVFASNKPAVAFYKKLGYKTELLIMNKPSETK